MEEYIEGGYFIVARKIFESALASLGVEYVGFAVALIGLANHKDEKWYDRITKTETLIKRGQFITSRSKLSQKLHCSTQKLRTALQHLENMKFLTRTTTKHYHLITLCKYDLYQNFKNYDNQRTNQRPTPPVTHEQPTDNPPLTINNELNESNELKERKKELNPFVELFNSTATSLPKIQAITDKRKTKIRTRLKEFPDLEWWKLVFLKANKVSIPGRNGKGDWKPSFDWLLENDTNALKVFEGNYDKQKHAGLKAWAKEQEEKYGE